MKIFYHDDMDGKCSAAIVWKREKNGKYISINYGTEFPLNDIWTDEKIYILDYSIPLDTFLKLWEITHDITWIDHHARTIEKLECNEIIKSLKGIRSSDKAACELTWDFLFPNDKIPEAVLMIGDYDTWKFKHPDTETFQEGIKLRCTNPELYTWNHLLSGNKDDDYLVDEIISDGEIAVKYRDSYYETLISSLSFETKFEGYKCIACNAAKINSKLFNSVKDLDKYDIMISFFFDGNQWTVSLYTSKDIDVAKLAEKYGGGGHKKAAGFQCYSIPIETDMC